MYFYFFFLVNHHIYIHLFFVVGKITFDNCHFGIFESFLVKVFFDKDFSTVNQVRGNLATFYQTQFGFKVFSFALLHTVVADIGNTRTLC